MPNRALKSYKQNSINTASPAELTMMLYNGAIKFMNLGKIAMEEEKIQERNNNLIRAQDIIGELRASLNEDFEISKELDILYDFVLDRLVEANINNDMKSLDEALEITQNMREAWKEVMEQSKKSVSTTK